MSATERPTPEQLAAIRERVHCANAEDGNHRWLSVMDDDTLCDCCKRHPMDVAADVPALLRWLEQAQKREVALREVLDGVVHPTDLKKRGLWAWRAMKLLAAAPPSPQEGD